MWLGWCGHPRETLEHFNPEILPNILARPFMYTGLSPTSWTNLLLIPSRPDRGAPAVQYAAWKRNTSYTLSKCQVMNAWRSQVGSDFNHRLAARFEPYACLEIP